MELNGATLAFIRQQAYQEVAKLTLTTFFYTGLVAALAPPMLLATLSALIDTPWSIALDRAMKVSHRSLA